MAGPLPAPVPSPQSNSSLFPQDPNPLSLSSSNQSQQNPSILLLRPSDPSARRSDPADWSSDRRLPSEPAALLALPALNTASAPARPSPELAPPSLAFSGSASASASAPAGHPAAPEAPPAVPPEPAAASPPLSNSLPIIPPLAGEPLSAHRADLQKRHPPVRRNAPVDPPLLKSYAQATMGASGPGFVRAHARDVESFARLPRTGINVICGTREGIPVFSLVQSDMHKVEGLYAKALVMKFHGGRPSLAASHKEISSWGLESPFSIGPLTSRSFLLRFQDERDLLKILTRPSSTLITFPYKIFRWHSRCHKNEDSVKVPVWITLPGLPLQCFAPEFLESIANRIGRFLCFDKATATLARPSSARMCIELDLREERLNFVLIDLFEGHKQPIVYERVPKFCSGCHVQGHTHVECSKTHMDTHQPQESGPISAVQERPQPVRRHDKELLVAASQENHHQVRAAAVAEATGNLSASSLPVQLPPDSSQQQSHPPLTSPVIASSEQQPCAPSPPSPTPTFPPMVADAQDAQNLQSSVLSVADPDQLTTQSTLKANSVDASQLHISPSAPSNSKANSKLSSLAAAISSPVSAPSSSQSPSGQNHFPPIKLMPRPRAPHVRSKAVAVPDAEPPMHQPSSQQHPYSPPSKDHPKHHKSVSIPQQSNIQANQDLWDVVNRHIAQINKARLSPVEDDPNSDGVHEEPPDPFESDSGASVHEDENRFPFPPQSYVSEGEELNVEPITLQGHISDDAFYQRPKSSKRNKRLPDGPLKVKLRARKGSSSIHR